MNIKNAEVSLLKASQIENGDVLLVRMSKKTKESMSAEKAHDLFKQIKSMVGDKEVGIFFFPKDLELSVIKKFLEKAEKFVPDESAKIDTNNTENDSQES